MNFVIKSLQKSHLTPLIKFEAQDVITLCKVAFDYLANGPEQQQMVYKVIAQKYGTEFKPEDIQLAVEALISLLIDATKAKVNDKDVRKPLVVAGFRDETVDILTQFVTSKRNFIEGSIKNANIRAYRLVNLEWRLEVKLASRAVMKQTQVLVTMKLYLHTEPKNENRDLLDYDNASPTVSSKIHEDEKRNRRDLLVQTDLSSLTYMIHTLENALMESRSRRIRNIVDAIH